MKGYFKGMSKKLGTKKVMRIERELEQSETKRMDLKRGLVRFARELMLGFRLDCNPPDNVTLAQNKSKEKEEVNFMKLMDRKLNTNIQLTNDMRPILKEI